MKFLKIVARNLVRSKTRTFLTLIGIGVSMFIFSVLIGLDQGVRRMIESTGGEDVLIVFEKYKACPPYSRLPVHYAADIEAMPHVESVMPVRFLLSVCGTTTELVAVHGVEPDKLRNLVDIQINEALYAEFAGERGAAIVGRGAAEQFGWQVGQQVSLPQLRGVSFMVRGIFSAPGSSLEQVVMVDREYLERSIDEVGQATLIMVKVDDPDNVDALAAMIDNNFATYDHATNSGPSNSFVAGQISAFRELVGFSQLVAYLALVLLLAAVANAMSMSVRDRMREIAVMKLLGYDSLQVGDLVIFEAGLLGVGASALGVGAAGMLFRLGNYNISVEGFTVQPELPVDLLLIAGGCGVLLSLLGAWLPARRAAQRPIVLALKGVD